MIFNELDCLETVINTPSVVGGAGSFDFHTHVSQFLNSSQYSNAISTTESQLGDAVALAVSLDPANLEQEV